MNDDEIEAGLRRVLADPARRLPDSMVPLDGVHAGARRRKARRQAMAAASGAVAGVLAVVAFVGVGHLTQGKGTTAAGATPTHTSLVGAGTEQPTPASSSPAPTASATSRLPVPAGFSPISVTAINNERWWLLGAGGQIAVTSDGGRSFTLVSDSATSGLPADAVELRFADKTHGWALAAPAAPANASTGQLWRTSDGGTTWRRSSLTQPVGSIELGGGTAYALVEATSDQWTVWATAADASGSWGQVGSVGSTYFMPLLAVQSGRALVATHGASGDWLYRIDAKATQRYTSPCDPSLGPQNISATVGSVWLTCAHGTGDGLYRSDDGSTWSVVPGVPGVADRILNGAIDAQHAAVALSGGSILVVSASGSSSTASSPSGAGGEWRYLAFTNSHDGFALTLDDHLLRTTDGGITWALVTFG